MADSFFALGGSDGGLFLAVGFQDDGALLTLGFHLLLHGFLDLARRDDIFDLHTVDLDAPFISGFVEDGRDLAVDGVAAGEGVIQLHLTNDVAQGGGGQALDGCDGLVDAVGVELGVHYLEEDHRVDLHGDIIAGDDRLGREVRHLLFQADLFGHPLNKRDLDMQAGGPGLR